MAHDHAYPSSLVVAVERIRVRVERDIAGMLQGAVVEESRRRLEVRP